ncbi:MAG: hypothetical protein ACD_46C00576G0005 [uncultured bacterium]|nr:MAG: hypothetical protein ACD_46C00576G0005 [uncultured bacterium]
MKNLTAIFEPAEEGGFICWFEEIPEAMSQGETIEEAKENLLDALKLVLEYRHEQTEIELRTKQSKITKEEIPLTAIR